MKNLKLNLLLVMAMVVASTEFYRTAAVDRIVGGSAGWNTPPNQFFFDIWAVNEGVIQVDDVLVFDFATGAHNVVVVSLSGHDRCDASEPTQVYTDGPARVPLTMSGLYCFISSVGEDCRMSFMRLIVRVDNTTAYGRLPQ